MPARSAHREEEYPTLPFRAVFWDGADAEDGVDAVAHVEDGLIVYLTRADGLELRLTVDELTLLYHFAISESVHQDEEVMVSQRIVGCQSTNHTHCYGPLWQCTACGKTVCSAEGSDDDPQLCDDCWAMKYPVWSSYNPLEDDVPF
jgi:hypothetical protein